MASDDGTYYDKLILAIDAMEKVLEEDSLVLYKEQCNQMIKDFMHVRDVLGERKDMKTDHNFSSILKELFRQTFGANAVLESCCCYLEVTQDNMTVRYSWLQVAVTQNDEIVFRVIWDELNWCLALVSKVGDPSEITEEEPRYYRYSTKLADINRELIDKDKRDLKNKLEEFLATGPPAGATAQDPDRLLATFLLARLNHEEEHVFFANNCESDNVWSKKQSLNDLGPSVTAIDWLGVRLARKVFRNQQANEDCLVEREIMRPLIHLNVVRFISCSDQGKVPAILMECVETTLEKYLEERAEKYAAQPSGWVGRISFNSGLNVLEVVDIMYQIAFVMAYLHGKGVAHCDIKPSNLLVNPCRVPGFEAYVQLKIADFGVSKSGLNEDCLRDSSKKSRGTTIYRAPELIGRAKNVDLKKADMFSYALTCWHILHGTAPFAKMRLATLHQDLLRGTRPAIDPEVPITLADLIRRCSVTNPQDRPTFSDVCIDLQRYKELLLGVVSLETISVPENKTIRGWKVFQSLYKTVKTLVMQIPLPQSCCKSKQDEDINIFPEDHMISECDSEREEEQTIPAPSCTVFGQLGVRGCFSLPESCEDFPAYSGSD